MKKQINILVSLAIILSIQACGSNPDLSGSSEPQPPQSQETPVGEEQPQPTSLPTSESQLDPGNPYFAIQTTLRSNPPGAGNKEIRKDEILELDAYLLDDSLNWRSDMVDFYSNMMGFVNPRSPSL